MAGWNGFMGFLLNSFFGKGFSSVFHFAARRSRRKRMKDYIRRFIIAGIMALCVSLLFLGGKHSQASTHNIEELTEHWIWPSEGIITDTFGTRHGHHKGIDIAAESGSPVYAVDDGVVTKSYYSDSYGHVIFIKHQNNTETVYAHMKERIAREGKTVSQGEKIGSMGSTGDSSGVHLHFEIHNNHWTYDKENAIDPFVAFGNEKVGQAVHVVHNEENASEVTASVANSGVDGTESQGATPSGTNSNNHEEKMKKPHEIIHIVQPGESLWSIAKKYQSTVNNIKLLNPIEGNQIIPHQKLVITKSDH